MNDVVMCAAVRQVGGALPHHRQPEQILRCSNGGSGFSAAGAIAVTCISLLCEVWLWSALVVVVGTDWMSSCSELCKPRLPHNHWRSVLTAYRAYTPTHSATHEVAKRPLTHTESDMIVVPKRMRHQECECVAHE